MVLHRDRLIIIGGNAYSFYATRDNGDTYDTGDVFALTVDVVAAPSPPSPSLHPPLAGVLPQSDQVRARPGCKWERLPSLACARTHHSSVVWGDCVFALVGNVRDNEPAVEILDEVCKKWRVPPINLQFHVTGSRSCLIPPTGIV